MGDFAATLGIQNSRVRSTGNMGTLSLGMADTADFLAGIYLSSQQQADRKATAASQFNSLVSIKGVNVTGYLHQPNSFMNSNVSVATLGTSTLLNPMTTNSSPQTAAAGTNLVNQVVPFAFPVRKTSDLVVMLLDSTGQQTTLTETTDYSVTINGSSGGSVTVFDAVPASSQIEVMGSFGLYVLGNSKRTQAPSVTIQATGLPDVVWSSLTATGDYQNGQLVIQSL
jgi:hypothetical protein